MTADEFKEARKKLDISQSAMGKKLGGYSLRAVQSWEAGTRKIPPAVETLMRIIMMLEE